MSTEVQITVLDLKNNPEVLNEAATATSDAFHQCKETPVFEAELDVNGVPTVCRVEFLHHRPGGLVYITPSSCPNEWTPDMEPYDKVVQHLRKNGQGYAAIPIHAMIEALKSGEYTFY